MTNRELKIAKRDENMFRSLSEDDCGFVNEGFSGENGKASRNGGDFKFNDGQSTRIEIARSKYDQRELHDVMMYKKPPSKSSEF